MVSSTRNAPLPGHKDGDVEICLSRKPEDRFVVHSVVLGLHSSYFKASLSSRWAGDNHGPAEEGTIKWRYQLRFDEESRDLNDPLDLLARASAEAVHATETPDINVDTAAMFTKYAPWVPRDNDKTTSRTYTIEAHRQYLKLVHHIPLAIDPSNFENAIKSIYALVRTADAYDSLTVVSMPVENFLIRNHSLDLENFSSTMYKELVDIAMKIRSHWLLREIGCRIIADPQWDDHDIECRLYSTGASELLLSKRAELRDLLKGIDQRVVIILPGKPGRLSDKSAITFATAAFREEISKLFNSHKKGDWISYARKFRLLEERLSQRRYPGIHRLYDKFGKPANIESYNFESVFRSLQIRTAEIIKPLFECVVKQPSAKLNKRDASYQGFLCIDLTDDDMPWKEDCHSTSTREREEEG